MDLVNARPAKDHKKGADSDAYKADPNRTVDRIKKGVKALQKRYRHGRE